MFVRRKWLDILEWRTAELEDDVAILYHELANIKKAQGKSIKVKSKPSKAKKVKVKTAKKKA